MIIHRSNRAEALIEALAGVVETPCGGPFDPELLVVQGQGMERWIAMELAKRRGVWANQQVLTLRQLVSDMAMRVLGEDVDAVFDPESMSWSIADALYELEKRPEFESIASYLEGDRDGRRRLQLAHRIADTFYRYMGYREEMLHGWLHDGLRGGGGGGAGSRPEDEEPDLAWQAALFRELVARHGNGHLAGRGRALIDRLQRGEVEEGCLPARLSIFGVSSLPRLHLDVVRAVARHCEVHLFVLSPTPEYWGDVATSREVRTTLQQEGVSGSAEGEQTLAQDLHLDVGHPLLSTFGKLGRDFHELLVEGGDLDFAVGDLHVEPKGEGLLAELQRDVFELSTPSTARSIDPDDRSLRIHACHGPMREVEVLCEELIASFEADPSLEPHDVVVMTPDIKQYAPYIEAVFGVRKRGSEAAARGEGEIPYRIADRWPDPRDEVVDAFLAGLDVISGRFEAPDVFDLLSRPCVSQRFELTPRDLEIIEGWLESSGIRWGLDAAHRAAEDQPAHDANTWRFGLDRLLLGVAIESDDAALFAGTRPDGDAEGQRAETLERLVEAVRFLETSRDELIAPQPPQRSCAALARFVEGLAADDDDRHDQHLLLKRALSDVAAHARDAGYAREVALGSIREQVDRQLQHARLSTGFLAGGVTFCELVPMRSIPFRFVGLLGMNDEVFPRMDHPPGFDWMARKPERGDRSMRDDDRFLFLEALLSARDRLVITYVGQSIRDGALVPPSVAVSELIDVICDGYAAGEGAEARQQVREEVELRHPLHPHGARYFGDLAERFPVHRRLHRELARIESGELGPEGPFVVRSKTVAEADGALAMDDLVAFYQAPVRSYLRDRLGIFLREEREPIAHREAYALGPLERANVGQRVLELVEAGCDPERAFELVCASGALPHGKAARVAFYDVLRDVEPIAQWSRRLGAANPMKPMPFAFDVAGTPLSGRFEAVCANGQVFRAFGRLGRASELRAWLWHLAWQVASQRDPARFPADASYTTVLGRAEDKSTAYAIRFQPVDDAEAHLARLIARYREGRRAPLPFFRNASRAFAQGMASSEDRAWSAARSAYEADDYLGFGDELDENVRLAFRGVDPLDPAADLAFGRSFAELACEVFAPLLAAREEL